ncbi:MAG: hypothetical protein ACI8U3_000654 [Brevundimonas sp.]|jgi:hypothetical protein|uniref:hypothetical protein n=1 Tax=Brevundimonas sp. TaxID=1871086 RepID=UPI0039E241F9
MTDWQVFSGVIAFATAFATAVTTYVQWRADSRQRKAHALSLYREFVSPEFYRCVSGPAYEVLLRFVAMPEPRHADYRAAIVRGWLGSGNRQDEYIARFGGAAEPQADAFEDHMRRVATREGLTEIQTLTAYLNFWDSLHALIHLRLVHTPTLRRLFGQWWRVNEGLLLPLVEEMDSAFAREGIAWRPNWIGAIRWLHTSEFFDRQPKLSLGIR